MPEAILMLDVKHFLWSIRVFLPRVVSLLFTIYKTTASRASEVPT
jgi:hypothetical protein